MKYLTLGTVVALLLTTSLLVTPAEPQTQPSPDAVKALMRMKLERSKDILEGLTLENLDAAARNARALKLLSRESGWNVLQTDEYASQSEAFRRAADLISEAATEGDVSRATLGYVELTVRCVECHSYMRKHDV